MIKTIRKISSGGILFRSEEKDFYVVLTSRHSRRGSVIWCLPKGGVEEGESLPETALREVREEGGVSGRIVEKIGQIEYGFRAWEENATILKTVHFYLMEYLNGNVNDHDSEVEEARWVPLYDAPSMLTHNSERGIMEKAIRCLTAGSAPKNSEEK